MKATDFLKEAMKLSNYDKEEHLLSKHPECYLDGILEEEIALLTGEYRRARAFIVAANWDSDRALELAEQEELRFSAREKQQHQQERDD